MAIGSKKNAKATASIYDFIFSESRKTPDKARSVKATGVDTTDAYVNAVTAVLEDPLMYVNKTTENAIRDVANIDVASISIGPAPTEKVKLSSSNVKDILNNDMKFVDNAFKRMESTRKAARASAFGWGVAGLTAAIMARKSGLDWETQDAIAHLGKSASNPTKNLDTKARSASLAQKYWEKSDFTNISKDVLIQSYGERQGTEMYRGLQEIGSKYKAEMAKGKDADMNNVFDVGNDSFLKLYPIFENTELAHKERGARDSAREARDKGDEEGAKLYDSKASGYRNAQNLVNVIGSDGAKDGYRKKHMLRRANELKGFKKEIELLRKSNDPDREKKIKKIQKEAREIQTQLRGFKWQDRAEKLGNLETYYGSAAQSWRYIMGGELLPAIINGDFFDPRKNLTMNWRPTDVSKGFALGAFDEKVNKKTGEITRTERSIDVNVARRASNPFTQKYYNMMTEVYYFTPKGIISTLTTGEGFAYRAIKTKGQLFKAFKEGGLDKSLGADFNFNKLFGPEAKSYLEELREKLGEEKYEKLMGFLSSNERVFKKFGSLQKSAHIFGFIGRTKNKITGFFTGKFASATKGLRTKFFNMFLKNVKGGAAEKLLENWVKSGGAKVLTEGLKLAIKSALAAYTGGTSQILNFLIDRVADLAISLAEKLAKPVLKFMLMALVVITLGIFVNLIINTMFISNMFASFSHIAPYEITLGETDYVVDVGSDPIYGDLEEWIGGPPLPAGEHCLLGSSRKYSCTQGPNDPFSHGNLPNAIDVGFSGTDWDGTFRAPQFCGKGGGNCTIEFYKPYACKGNPMGGGMQVLLRAEYKGTVYEFLLVHVILNPSLSVGSTVNAGEAVVNAQLNSPPPPACWDGAHLHLETKVNGALVNPCHVLTGDPSTGGFGCDLDDCALKFNPSGSCAR